MGMIKVRSWELMFIKLIGLPILKKLNKAITEQAKTTENKFDDTLADAFKIVIAFLKNPNTFEKT